MSRVDEKMQADWNRSLWGDIVLNLSATDSLNICLGGCLLEFSDQWWKISPFFSQETGGFKVPGGHPDNFANEEFFGLVDPEFKSST
jgi:hypothetical protein